MLSAVSLAPLPTNSDCPFTCMRRILRLHINALSPQDSEKPRENLERNAWEVVTQNSTA